MMSTYDAAPNLPAPQGDAALRKAAAGQIDLEIGQAVAPIQTQIRTTEAREERALGQIGGMFDAIQPVVNQAAQGVQTAYDQALSQEQAIYAQAQAQLQSLRGQRAGEAQKLAQQIGGPVAIDQFTQPYDDAGVDLSYLGAGQQLHTMAYAQAGVQYAQGFAGQVMPLVRTEQMATTRNMFEEQVREYQEQITALKSQRGAQVNKRFNELRTQELEYGLQRATYQLDKLNKKRLYDLEVKTAKQEKAQADRQYKLDKQTFELNSQTAKDNLRVSLRLAANDERKTDLAWKQYDLEIAQALGKFPDGKKTLDAISEDNRHKEAMKAYGLSEEEWKFRKADMAANRSIALARLKSSRQTGWVDLIENAITPQPGKTITNTVLVPATLQQVYSGTAGVFPDPDSPTGYSMLEERTVTPVTEPIKDPNRLVDYLVDTVDDPKIMPRSRAIALVKSRVAELPDDWKYGDKFTLGQPATTTPKTPAKTAAKGPKVEETGFVTPSATKVYNTPSGPMRISDAREIATGQATTTPQAQAAMRTWFHKNQYAVEEPDYTPATGGYKVPLNSRGRFDLTEIRRQAAAGNKGAKKWLKDNGWNE
jgi:hypothetical protein